MQIDPKDLKKARDRLVRAHGQLAGVIKMLDEGRDCTEVLTQLSAASSALSRSGFSIIVTAMALCEKNEKGEAERAKLERAFLSLA